MIYDTKKIFKYNSQTIDMNVYEYIQGKRKSGPLHFVLIDPDKQEPEKAAELAARAKEYGSDAIMIGGSNPMHLMFLDRTIENIKKRCDLPVILFPSSHSALSKRADALFFMSLLNSRSTQYLIGEQMRGSVLVKQYGLEPLSMAYLIVESGTITSAAWSGDVKPIPREKPSFAAAYALAAKYFGMRFVYLEAGSGAEKTVPNKMVGMVKKAVGDTMVIVGGGIRDAKTAKEKVAAGADIIVTGKIAEDDTEKLKRIIQVIKNKD